MTTPLAVELSAAVSPPERESIRRLLEAGRAQHPSLALSPDEFAAGAIDRAGWTAGQDGGDRREALAAMERRGRGADLYLVLACDAGAAGAWDRLVETMLPAVARALATRGVRPLEADAEAKDLPGHLIQPPRHGRSRTRLGGYLGVSSLATFLTVAAFSRWTSERRARPMRSLSDTEADEPDPDAGAPPAPADPPLSRLVEAERAAQFEREMPRAWAALSSQEQLALVCKCRDGLPQKSIALLLGVGAPRVSRLLDGAYGRLRRALAGTISGGDDGGPLADTAGFRGVIDRILAISMSGPRRWEEVPRPDAVPRPSTREPE